MKPFKEEKFISTIIQDSQTFWRSHRHRVHGLEKDNFFYKLRVTLKNTYQEIPIIAEFCQSSSWRVGYSFKASWLCESLDYVPDSKLATTPSWIRPQERRPLEWARVGWIRGWPLRALRTSTQLNQRCFGSSCSGDCGRPLKPEIRGAVH